MENTTNSSLARVDDAFVHTNRGRARALRCVGAILELIDEHLPLTEPLFVLDAGCGKGLVAAELASCDLPVIGVDASAADIEFCRAHRTGTYVHARLDTYEPAASFDCVYSIDALHHITDDGQWAATVRNLVSLTHPGGIFVVAGHENAPAGRSVSDCLVAAHDDDLAHRRFRPFATGAATLGFHVFARHSEH